MLNRIVYLLMTILLQQRITNKYLLQLNKTTFHNVQLKAVAPLSNYTLFNLCYAMRALLLFASKQWNDLMERWDPSWNSSPQLVDLTSFSAPLELVERLRPA